ncbi:MAG: copper chaperone PCu(A)C [Lysobacterales bacterium]
MSTIISAVGRLLFRCRYIGPKSEKMQNLALGRALVLGIVVLLSGCDHGELGLEMTSGYVRLPPPGMRMTAAFGTLNNRSDSTKTIVAFSSPQFSDVSLHRTVFDDGIAKMREVATLSLDPGEQRVMKPGGLHLMLMGSQQVLAVDDTVTVEWKFDDGAVQETVLSVQKR